MGLLDRAKTRLASLQVAFVPPALPQMQLGPEDSTENPLMVRRSQVGRPNTEADSDTSDPVLHLGS